MAFKPESKTMKSSPLHPSKMHSKPIAHSTMLPSPRSAIAIYTEKLWGCANADHGDDTGRNTIRSIRNCTLIRKRSWGVAFANCTESGHAFLMEKQKKSWLSNLNETLRNPAHNIQAKYNPNLSQTLLNECRWLLCTVSAWMETVCEIQLNHETRTTHSC